MSDENKMAIIPMKPVGGSELYRTSTDAAGLCKQIVLETAMEIQGKKYIRVDGWLSIAIAHGCFASAENVERIEGGYRAIGKIIRAADGQVLCTSEGFVGDDETTWAKRPVYARRAMAQTRAISRACRSAFAHVVVMMNAGLQTTPAEEVPYGGFDDAKPVKATVTKIKKATTTPATGAIRSGTLEELTEAIKIGAAKLGGPVAARAMDAIAKYPADVAKLNQVLDYIDDQLNK